MESLAVRTQILLPETGLVAAFRIRGTCLQSGVTPLPGAVVSGLQGNTRTMVHSADSRMLVARFTEIGAASFLPQPLHLLFGTATPVEDLIPRNAVAAVSEQLAEVDHNAARFAAVERFLLAQFRDRTEDPLSKAVAAHIREANGVVRVAALAREFGLSVSALERRFRRSVGSSPKHFASIVRLRRVFRLKEAGGNLTGIAYDAGYSDQPHFIKDFKRFTSQTPETFFRQYTPC